MPNEISKATGEMKERAAELQPTPQEQSDHTGGAISFFAGIAGDSISNFPGDAITRWKLESSATSECLGRKEAIEAGTIPVKYVYCHKVLVESINGGELVDAIRTVLITPNGKAFGFVSNGIAASAAQLLKLLVANPKLSPISVRVVESETRKGRRVLSLVPAE